MGDGWTMPLLASQTTTAHEGGAFMNAPLRLTLVTMSVGGGFLGLALAGQMLLGPEVQLLTTLQLMLLFLFVTVSGLVCVQWPHRSNLLVVALALQVPLISSPFFTYRLGAGCSFIVGVVDARFYWHAVLLGSRAEVGWFGNFPWGIGINLVAASLLILLLVARKNAHSKNFLPPSQPGSSQEIAN
jgi:hypothetical protein